MKVLVVSSEVAPFAKTGGLADVSGSLPPALAALGHDVRVAMPKYGVISDDRHYLVPILGDIHVRVNGSSHVAHVLKAALPNSKVPVYFIQNSQFFDRDGLYGEGGRDYEDNHVRFAFFCKAVVWLLKGLDWMPDVIHCNDWQTALVPVFLRNQTDMLAHEDLQAAKVLLSIHNLAYQGVFPAEHVWEIGLGPELFHPAAMEFYGQLNLLKGGLVFADALSTVSPRYAEEIQTEEIGCGLEGVVSARRTDLHGIINGVDYSAWNPETDSLIPATYSAANLDGKAACKAALQKELGLEPGPRVPLIGMVTRLDPQKGLDLVAEAIPEIMGTGSQLVILGTGAPDLHAALEKAARQFPGQFAAALKFDNGLAHRIEAGADIFLMPSRYEPCGLNQIYSLRYGTVPVVRETGGLADSITDATTAAIKAGKGTGFMFKDYTAEAMLKAIRRALKAYDDRGTWTALMKRGMAEDYSWKTSARKYEAVYQQMIEGA